MATAHVDFYSNALGRQVSYQAVIPVTDPDASHRLPTLYLLHGIMGNQTSWMTNTRIAALAARYAVAVIMPDGGNSFYVDHPAPLNRYGAYIGEELVQHTRRLFPLSAHRRDTWIGGLSMGGYGAIRNGLKYSQTFSAILALSAALVTYNAQRATEDEAWVFARRSYLESVFGDLTQLAGGDKDIEALCDQLKVQGGCMPRLFLACGTDDPLLSVNRRFHDFLLERAIAATYCEAPGQHDWTFWDTTIEQGLAWLVESQV
jgi:S-formylglutathione hydrolase FrmB